MTVPKSFSSLLIVAVLLLSGLLAASSVQAHPMRLYSHRQPAHIHHRAPVNPGRKMNANPISFHRYQQKHFNIDQNGARASGKMIQIRRKQDATGSVLHKRTYTDREIHDDYEQQQHELETALEHYVTHGDSQSLQAYLTGFKLPFENSSSQDSKSHQDEQTAQKKQHKPGHPATAQKPSDNASQMKEIQGEDCEQVQDHPEQGQSGSISDEHKQPSQSQQHQSQPPKQQQQKAQQQSLPAPGQQQDSQPDPDTHPNAKDSQSRTETHGGHQSKNSEGIKGTDSSSSVWGYSPPSFGTTTAPTTMSLYSASSTPFQGHATFYDTGMGACGIVNTNDQPIVAVSRDIFQQYNPTSGNPNQNSLCGRRIEIVWNGQKQHAFAMDECPGCKPKSLDLSPKLFQALDNPDKGDLNGITWKFV